MFRKLMLMIDQMFRRIGYGLSWARIILALAFIAALWVPAFLFAWWGWRQDGLLGIAGFLAWVLFLRMFVPPAYGVGIGAIKDGWAYLITRSRRA